MSNNAHIDKIFKDGIGEKQFSNVDAMWQQMELSLDQDNNNKKRRIAFFIVIACLLTGGFFAANLIHQQPASSAQIDQANNTLNNKQQPVLTAATNTDAVKQTASMQTAKDVVVAGTNANAPLSNTTAVSINNSGTTLTKSKVKSSAKTRMSITTADGDIAEETPIVKNSVSNNDIDLLKASVVADLLTVEPTTMAIPVIKLKPAAANITASTQKNDHKKVVVTQKKISIDLIAGGDILRMNRKTGYYAGVRLSRTLEKGTVISAGLSYSSNAVNDKYRYSSKPAEMKDADIQLSNIQMMRLPVYFQRQLATSDVSLMVGLVPSYIIKASVYNVPNSFTGSNPDQYRKFVENDLNRFNILFGAGLKYAPVNNIAFELSGSYGFTSLVKNSYMNQSRVNDNFKSIQLGVVFKLR